MFDTDLNVEAIFQSKDTYGHTRGLSNLEMKHVGELAIIGALLKAVKTSYGRTMQGPKGF